MMVEFFREFNFVLALLHTLVVADVVVADVVVAVVVANVVTTDVVVSNVVVAAIIDIIFVVGDVVPFAEVVTILLL